MLFMHNVHPVHAIVDHQLQHLRDGLLAMSDFLMQLP